MARPFLRWAGSKRLMIPHLLNLVPRSYGTYFEPFLGGGALFLRLAPPSAVLGDALEPLVNLWRRVADSPEPLVDLANSWAFNKETYNSIRRQPMTSDLARAAQFLYLNRGAFSGLWRVNRDGEFNVPWGQPKTASPLSASNIRAVSNLLSRTDLKLDARDFAETTRTAAKGDLVFLDPPYAVSHRSRGFIHYNEKLFAWPEQERLAGEAQRLSILGVSVIVANVDHPSVRELYTGFGEVVIERSSTLAARASGRTSATESLFFANI